MSVTKEKTHQAWFILSIEKWWCILYVRTNVVRNVIKSFSLFLSQWEGRRGRGKSEGASRVLSIFCVSAVFSLWRDDTRFCYLCLSLTYQGKYCWDPLLTFLWRLIPHLQYLERKRLQCYTYYIFALSDRPRKYQINAFWRTNHYSSVNVLLIHTGKATHTGPNSHTHKTTYPLMIVFTCADQTQVSAI